MGRNGLILAAFLLCLAVALAAMGWISATVLRLDRSAFLEENVRLALWRMDSGLSPLIAQETARPYFDYTPLAPAERAYTRMFAEIGYGEVLVPSPLLGQEIPLVKVHFQIHPDHTLTSPQAPDGKTRDIALAYATEEQMQRARDRLAELEALLSHDELLARLPATEALDRNSIIFPVPQGQAAAQVGQFGNAPVQSLGKAPQQAEASQSPIQEQQQQRSTQEFQARNVSQANTANYELGANRFNRKQVESRVREGVMRPLWVRDELILARRFSINGQEYVQGCWLDFPAVQSFLLDSVKDLLPDASIQPATDDTPSNGLRRLAALPATLLPGTMTTGDAVPPSAVRMTLYIAWACVLVGSAAVAALLFGALRLSQRRADFVSAVTHELRTPLTTVSMYAEMLQEGMVRDEPQRKRYLSTLRAEAERLGHLVENVLAYSRIERGRARTRIQDVALAEILAATEPRLRERAEQAHMTLDVLIDDATRNHRVRADISAVEQVLFNLVDNACKYASAADDRRIELRAEPRRRILSLLVLDHGPGLNADERRKLFRPFSKSAREAAQSAPGVGLGLALSRRLARAMNGDLRWLPSDQGARFALDLPSA